MNCELLEPGSTAPFSSSKEEEATVKISMYIAMETHAPMRMMMVMADRLVHFLGGCTLGRLSLRCQARWGIRSEIII